MTGARGEILVVDDDPLNRAILQRGLEREGRRDDRVGRRRGARRSAADPVDLVLLDIVMPRMDGFRVLDEMKADPACERSRSS